MNCSSISSGIAASVCNDCSYHMELCIGSDLDKVMESRSLAFHDRESGEIVWDDEAIVNHEDYHIWIYPQISNHRCSLHCEGDGALPGLRYIAHGWKDEKDESILIHLELCENCHLKHCA